MKAAALSGAALLALGLLASAGAAAPAAPRSDVRAAVETLDSILAARNDNDPRLDRDFNSLSPEARRAFRRKYFQLPAEARNERGTIVYLLGKNLRSPEDWAFLREVAAEPPCLSLSSCARASAAPEPGDAVTLAYPALVALEQARRALGGSGEARRQALSVVAAGESSRAPAVARLARRIRAADVSASRSPRG